jgi:hypothetical protein
MRLPAEPIRSIPGSAAPLAAIEALGGNAQDPSMKSLCETGVSDTIGLFNVV